MCLAVPDSELVLKSISFVEKAERMGQAGLLAAGIGEERVVLLEATDRSSDHMSLYGAMDGLGSVPLWRRHHQLRGPHHGGAGSRLQDRNGGTPNQHPEQRRL